MKLEVVTIGTELLLGLTPDTNAAELGRALAAAGVEVVRHVSVADRPEAIRAAVGEALARTGFVVTTGGLGPTRDDMTKREVLVVPGPGNSQFSPLPAGYDHDSGQGFLDAQKAIAATLPAP